MVDVQQVVNNEVTDMATKLKERRQSGCKSTRSSLVWTRSAERLWQARARGGIYWLVGDGIGRWSAQWRPAGGKVEYLGLGLAEALAKATADRHLIEIQAGDILATAGGEDLNRKDLRGQFHGWKQRRF